MTWAGIYRHYYEEKGWDPERINRHTPSQLYAISGRESPRPSFQTLEESLAWAKAKNAGG